MSGLPSPGGVSPLLGGLSALASAVPGFFQGEQMGMQNRLLQQQLQEEKMRTSQAGLGMAEQLAQTNPGLLKQPNFAQFVNRQVQPIGLNFGNQLPSSFGSMVPQLLQNPQAIYGLQALDPGMRSMFKPYLGGMDDSFWSAPAHMLPQYAVQSLNSLRMMQNMFMLNGADPKSPAMQNLSQQIAQVEQSIPGFPAAPVSVGSAFGAAPTKGQAMAGYYGSRANLYADTARWLDRIKPAQLAQIEATTGLKREEMSLMPRRLLIQAQNAATAAGRLDVANHQLQMAQETFGKLGMTPQGMSAYNGLMNSLGNGVKAEQSALAQTQSALNGLLKNTLGQPPSPTLPGQVGPDGQPMPNPVYTYYQTLMQRQQHLEKQLSTHQAQLQHLRSSQSTYAKKLQTHLLHRAGAPHNTAVISEPKAVGGDTSDKVSRALHAVRGLPRKDAVAQVRSAASLSAQEKGIILRALASMG